MAQHSFVLSISFSFLFFFFLISNHHNSFTDALSTDLINTTCKQCATTSTVFDYNLCLTSLQAIPVSHATNLQGLALVSMELAMQNATNTMSKIEKLLVSGECDGFATECLKDCLELYEDAIIMLVDSIGAFLGEDFVDSKVLVSATMEASISCEEGFLEREGEVSPLNSENYYLYELSDIALCIINLLSLQLPTMYS